MNFFNDMEDHGSTMAMEAQTRSQLRPLAAETKIQTPQNFNNNSSIGKEKTNEFEANVDLEDEDEEEDYEEEEEEDDEKFNGITRGRGFER
ncbi:hypothetical protein D8674_011889 [Pyrus ussuriensis x Pyrus communis]|uniref:Uncharacterized protein n=1 Tax=Pyrus ussuriensis x Pyrus communis TaxID=2448454 RepID=A0A5N5G4M7_9ROSA|nr:hypothetical protein D8674_011889 [Pyrus ussuriensis x Pyrus communis]